MPMTEAPGRGVERMVEWAGLLLHEPHHDALVQHAIPDAGVYIAWLWFGSPAATHGIRPTRRILEVNGLQTPDLDAFLAAVAPIADAAPVRLTLASLDGRITVDTLELDSSYWPTQVFEMRDGRWTRTEGPGGGE